MTSFWKFHAFQVKYMMGIQDLRYRIKTTSGLIPKMLALLIPVLILGAIIVAPYLLILYFCYEMMALGGSPETYVNLVLFLSQILILFFSLLSSFTAMFGRKDHELLSSLPIPKRYIYMSSVLHVYGSGILTSAFVLIPSIVIYSIGQGVSLQMIFMAIPAIVLSPVLPVCIAFAFVLLVMRVIAYCPFKEQLATIFGIAFLIAYMVFNLSFSEQFGEWIVSLNFVELFENSGWFSALVKILPGVYLTRITLMGSPAYALLALLGTGLISGLLLVCMYFVGGKSFFAVRTSLSMHANRKKAKMTYKTSKPFWAYMKKEYRGILRSPVYIMNGLLGILLGPIMFIYLMSGEGISTAGMIEELEALGVTWIQILFPLIVLSVAHFMAATITMVPSTSYSREGKSRWVTQVAPVSVKMDFIGRVLASLMLVWLSDLLSFVCGWYCFGLSLQSGILYLLPLLIAAVPSVVIALYVDYKRPKLEWEKEAQAMKQNTNALIGMGVSFLISILCLLPMILCILGYLNLTMCLILTLLVPVLLAVISVSIILNKLNRRIVV